MTDHDFSFDVPAWVPPDVRVVAQSILALIDGDDESDEKEILLRLLSHEHMKRVWTELSKRNRNDKGYLTPARGPHNVADFLKAKLGNPKLTDLQRRLIEADIEASPPPTQLSADELDELQNEATAQFFQEIFEAATNIHVEYRDNKREERLAAVAAKLSAIAAELGGMDERDLAEDLDTIADMVWAKGPVRSHARSPDSPTADDPWLLARVGKRDEIRAFVVHASFITRRLFGAELQGTLANIATAVFEKKVTVDTVRDILAPRG